MDNRKDHGVNQQLDALQIANTVSQHRARLKRQLAQGTVSVMTLITDHDFRNDYVVDVLALQHRWGEQRANRALAAVQIPLTVRCGDMTGRQKALLSRWLRAGKRERADMVFEEEWLWTTA